MTLTDAVPLAVRQAQHRLTLRPGAQNEKGSATLAQSRGEACDTRVARSLRWAGDDNPHDIRDRRRDGEPLVSRSRHEHEPIQIDAEACCGLDAELGNTHDRAPRSCGRRTSQQSHDEHRRTLHRIDSALFEATPGQQGSDGGMSGDASRIELRRLHLANALLQLGHALVRDGPGRDRPVSPSGDGEGQGGRHPFMLEHMFDCVNCGGHWTGVSQQNGHMTQNWTPLAITWLVLAIAGLIGTWTFNALAIVQMRDFVGDWVTSGPAVSSLTVDLLIVAIAGCVLIVVESRRLGMKRAWLYIVLSGLTAFAFTFPLFLAMRERRLQAVKSSPNPGV